MVKYHESTYEDYLRNVSKCNFHKELIPIIEKNTSIKEMSNYLFNGPSGVGKYSQALRLISRFSPSKLKYEKKVHLTINKGEYMFKISDIHYEVDFLTLGCNAKITWTEIFNTIVNIVSSNGINSGIILCLNFNHIQIELLDIFYSYMQQIFYLPINLRFIFLTDSVSFMPTCIVNNVNIINIGRPLNINIKEQFPTHLKNVDNLKELYMPVRVQREGYKIVDGLIEMIMDRKLFKIVQLRETLYDLLTYDIKIYDVLNAIISKLIEESKLDLESLPLLMTEMHKCMYHYNNNYRPIYHLENMIVKILIHANK